MLIVHRQRGTVPYQVGSDPIPRRRPAPPGRQPRLIASGGVERTQRGLTMACYRDLHPCPYFGAALAPHLVAVGWLGMEMEYTRGAVDAAFREKLCSLVA